MDILGLLGSGWGGSADFVLMGGGIFLIMGRGISEDFSLLLLVLFRGFCVGLSCPHLAWKNCVSAISVFFCGFFTALIMTFWAILRVLAIEKSSEN